MKFIVLVLVLLTSCNALPLLQKDIHLDLEVEDHLEKPIAAQEKKND